MPLQLKKKKFKRQFFSPLINMTNFVKYSQKAP